MPQVALVRQVPPWSHLVKEATRLLLRTVLFLSVPMQPVQLLVKLRKLLLHQRKLFLCCESGALMLGPRLSRCALWRTLCALHSPDV